MLARTLPATRLVTARLAAGVQSRTAGRPAGHPDSHPESGMTTAEYAVGTVAACGFSGVLYKVLTSDSVLELVKGVIEKAFHLGL